MSMVNGTIFEVNQAAFLIPTPIWEKYANTYPQFGLPYSSTYLANQGNEDFGWRADFSEASVIWNPSRTGLTVWEGVNVPWKAMFCPGENNYTCTPVRRRDPYIYFNFPDSNNPGPLKNTQGFSALWETSLDGDWLSKIGLGYEFQGNIRFYINGDPITQWISSEQGMSGEIAPKWFINAHTFAVRFWQSPGRAASIRVEVTERGLLPEVQAAFEPTDELGSYAYQWAQIDLANFDPPSYPGDGSDPPITPPETPPVIEPPDFQLPNLRIWWKNFQSWFTERLNQWWQEKSEEIIKKLEEELLRFINSFIQSVEQQCLGGPAIILTTGGGVVFWKLRRKR